MGKLWHKCCRFLKQHQAHCAMPVFLVTHCSVHTHYGSLSGELWSMIWLWIMICFQVLPPSNPASLMLKETSNPNYSCFESSGMLLTVVYNEDPSAVCPPVLRGSFGLFVFSFSCLFLFFLFRMNGMRKKLSGGVQVQIHVARETLLFLTGPVCLLC